MKIHNSKIVERASNDVEIPVDDLVHAYGYDGSDNLTTITLSYLGVTYIKTFVYSGSNLTNKPVFVAQ